MDQALNGPINQSIFEHARQLKTVVRFMTRFEFLRELCQAQAVVASKRQIRKYGVLQLVTQMDSINTNAKCGNRFSTFSTL